MKKVKLTSVCRPKQWKSIPISELSDVGYPVYGANGVIGYYDSYNHEQETVIITCRGATCGTVNLTHPRSYVTGNAMCLDNVKDSVDIKYLFYSMQAYDFTKVISGTAQPQITRVGLEKVEITLPSLDVQREIVSILDKIDALIEQRRLQLKKLEELVKARFVEMFGDPAINPMNWDKVNISEVVGGKISNGFFAKRDDYVDDGNVSVMGVAYVVNRMYSQWQDLPKTNGTDKDIEKFEVKYGDMLFCRSSLVAEGIGKASIVPEDVPNNTLFECHVIRFPLDLNKCVPEYMQVLSTTEFFRQQIIAQSKTATMTTIGQNGILKADIILPPLEKQKEFYAFVKQIDKSKLLSGCRLFHSWAPEIEKSESCWRAPTEDKGFAGRSTPTMTLAGLENLNHVGAP